MNNDLERLEALYHDIISAREEEQSESRMWDCLERLGQEMLVLRLQFETERRWSDCNSDIQSEDTRRLVRG